MEERLCHHTQDLTQQKVLAAQREGPINHCTAYLRPFGWKQRIHWKKSTQLALVLALMVFVPCVSAFRSLETSRRLIPLGAAALPFLDVHSDPFCIVNYLDSFSSPPRHTQAHSNIGQAAGQSSMPLSWPDAQQKGSETIRPTGTERVKVYTHKRVPRVFSAEDLEVWDVNYDEPEKKKIPDIETCLFDGLCKMHDGKVTMNGISYACAPSGDQRLNAKVSPEQCQLWYRA